MADPALFAPSRFGPPRQALSVSRPALCEALDLAVHDAGLVLLVAPGGSGKTTALAWWAAEDPRRRVVWARLEPQDDDPVTLASLLLAALRHLEADSGHRLEGLLAAGTGLETRRLAAALLVDLAELGGVGDPAEFGEGSDPAEVALVLDDLHTISGTETMALLDAVLDGLPSGVRVLAAARHEPALSLPRRRVRHEVAEFRARDLRLDLAAVRALLERAGAPPDVDPELVLSSSGGWAAAAQLTAIGAASGRWHPDTTAPRMQDQAALDDFLAQEIFDELPPDLSAFLLDTCLLPELTVEHCDRVTGRDDAGRLLRLVEARDLFVTHQSSGALRFHDLFAAFLGRQLARLRTEEEVQALRLRAAACAPTGDAIRLLVEAGAPDDAAALVTEAARSHLTHGGPPIPESWLLALPAGAARRHPWVALIEGVNHVRRGTMDQALASLHDVPAAMAGAGEEIGRLEADFALLEAHMGLGAMEEAAQLVERLAVRARAPDDQIRLLAVEIWFAYFACDWEAVSTHLARAFELASGPATTVGRRVVAQSLGTELLFVDQGPGWVTSQMHRLGARLGDDAGPTAGLLSVVGAAAAFLAGRPDEAASGLDEARRVADEHGGLGWTGLAIDRVDLVLALHHGDCAAVAAVTAAAWELLGQSSVHQQERSMYAWAEAYAALQRGRADEVAAIRDRWLGAVDPHDRPDVAVTRLVLDAINADHHGDRDRAREVLEAAAELHETVRFAFGTGQPLLAMAALELDRGDNHTAVTTARPALDRAAALDAPGLLVQEGPVHRPLLEACAGVGVHRALIHRALATLDRTAAPARVSVPGSGAELTAREVEVLTLVAAGASNRTIAEQLFIGERTVKTHMTSLMRKLGVTSRTQAAARARELGVSA